MEAGVTRESAMSASGMFSMQWKGEELGELNSQSGAYKATED